MEKLVHNIWKGSRVMAIGMAMASRIDEFLISEDIARGIGEIIASFLLAARSDHWLISINWDWSNSIITKPFRFEIFLLEHKYFKDW